jgi:hypothetical protein
MKLATSLLTSAAVLVIGLAGCATHNTASGGTAPVNKTCPVSGKAVNPDATVSYKGQTVGFCCSGCPATWSKMSDADKDAKLAAAKK